MKKIIDYRKRFDASKTTSLKELKSTYRNFMKECHPDKFHGDEVALLEAEHKSKEVIEAYHFLVSIAPETVEQELPEFTETITTAGIADFRYERQCLKIEYSNGSAYEFFGVPKNTYIKFVNADSPGRFARRHIYTEFVYRKVRSQE